MIAHMQGIKGIRDRALILIGFAGALRRSELVAIERNDIEFVTEGLTLRIRRSKTDQEGQGRTIGIPYARSSACPLKAFKAWLNFTGIEEGPVFTGVTKGGLVGSRQLSAHAVAVIVKDYAAKAGLPAEHYSGHSLRAGLITSAAKLGVSTFKIRQTSGHKSDAMLQRYIRDAELFIGNAAGSVL